jgi:hypothetical protein
MDFVAEEQFIECQTLIDPSPQNNFNSSSSFLFRIVHKGSTSCLPQFIINKVIIAD